MPCYKRFIISITSYFIDKQFKIQMHLSIMFNPYNVLPLILLWGGGKGWDGRLEVWNSIQKPQQGEVVVVINNYHGR